MARPQNSLCTLRAAGCPNQHATLASGCWPTLPGGIGYPQGSNERFQLCILTSLPPFPSFAWRKDISGLESPGLVEVGKCYYAPTALAIQQRLQPCGDRHGVPE